MALLEMYIRMNESTRNLTVCLRTLKIALHSTLYIFEADLTSAVSVSEKKLNRRIAL